MIQYYIYNDFNLLHLTYKLAQEEKLFFSMACQSQDS